MGMNVGTCGKTREVYDICGVGNISGLTEMIW